MSKLDHPNFHFEYSSLDQKLKEIEELDPKLASQVNDISVKIIKENKDIVVFFIHHNFNNSLSSCGSLPVENYRPIRIFPTFSKIY